jgi:hypothetical protein
MKIEGVPITFGTQGASINTSKLEQKIKNKVSSMIWGWIIGAFILVVMVVAAIGVGIYVWLEYRSSNTTSTSVPGPGKTSKWDGKSPFECSGAENVVIDGVTANLPSTTAIKASANCNLTLTNVKVTSGVGIDASGNAKVVVRGGSINGTTNSIVASANAQVTVEGGATVSGGKTKTSGNGKVNGVK